MSAPSRTSSVLFAALLLPVSATAQPYTARVVAMPAGATEYTAGAVQARVGEPVQLAVVLLGPRRAVFADVPSVTIDGRRVVPRGSLPAGARVQWIQVEPRRAHVDHPSPNPGLDSFSNAVLFGPRHGRWLGYDRLEYTATAVAPSRDVTADGATIRVRAAHPTDTTHDTHGGAGSVWYAAEITLADGTIVRTPDHRSVERPGLSRDVQRVSFRASDDYVGWLGTYFHTTSVFASNGPTDETHQSDRYTGADCADVLIGALRASGRREAHYTSVAGIGEYARAYTGVLRITDEGVFDRAGAPVTLRWGAEVSPGDLVTIDYADDPDNSLPRDWDHIGALVEDRGTTGVFDARDILRHMGGHGLEDTPVVHGGPMRVVLWRWRPRARR